MKPIVLIAGGPGRKRVSPDPVLLAALAESGVARPSVAYLGSASGDHPGFFGMIRGFLQDAGAGEVTLAATVAPRADVRKAAAQMEAADIVFVSGGDVEEGMQALEQRGFVPVLQQLHRAGKFFVGLSAGSIMLARHWVRWADPDDDATVQAFDCLGLAEVECDVHAEEEQWGELQALLRLQGQHGRAVGYGIPAGGGLCVRPAGKVTAIERPVAVYACARGVVRAHTSLAPRPRIARR